MPIVKQQLSLAAIAGIILAAVGIVPPRVAPGLEAHAFEGHNLILYRPGAGLIIQKCFDVACSIAQ